MHEDAQVPMEEQNREVGPPIDEIINVPHVSKIVGLYDNAQEANEETNVEFDLPNGEVTNMHLSPEIVQPQRDAEIIIEVSNVHVNNTTGNGHIGDKGNNRHHASTSGGNNDNNPNGNLGGLDVAQLAQVIATAVAAALPQNNELRHLAPQQGRLQASSTSLEWRS
ncbi:hypothetical protein RHSIM_Rhsim05G0114500 [Rhododendron simsii]|uniref:Uncharacterized protein n=1 Tax=Rhododendron simsii TaxID=118357 RepID=A0A834GX61_RHOSS|nr:hypothetical protein RHSIM_Rhsim05G0114500 [Rhododendron simsii]